MKRYVLVTPAHDEEAFIEATIESVAAQTIRPLRWIVVNDASTDSTREIVEGLVRRYDFLRLVNVERSAGRHFGNKVRAFERGLQELGDLDYDFVGNLDADITLDPDYYERILHELEANPSLGIAGGMVHTQIGGRFVSQDVALDSCAGAVQLFRRACFEQIGGYMALPHGGIDAAAEVTARMHGWAVRTFPEHPVWEHRRTGSAVDRPLAARVREGRRMYSLGYSFPFFLARRVYRIAERPRFVGSAAALFGYVSAMLAREPVLLPPETVRYLRSEQRHKLRRVLRLRSQTAGS